MEIEINPEQHLIQTKNCKRCAIYSILLNPITISYYWLASNSFISLLPDFFPSLFIDRGYDIVITHYISLI